jgi:predicted Zn-ribbon and HTH transcriptional regulator
VGTRRQDIVEALTAREMSPRELSLELGLRIGDLLADLEHVARSLKKRLRVRPARCASCGFSFTKRGRLATPSRCPMCRSERIEGPYLRVSEG